MTLRRFVLLLAVALSSPGCIKSYVINSAADALASDEGGAFASEPDPEFAASAVPFGLKTIESLIDAQPDNPKLYKAAASGFTSYGYAFLQQDADKLDESNPEQSRHLLARAKAMYARAQKYGLKGLDAKHEGFSAEFAKDRAAAVKNLEKEDVPLVYWTAAPWALLISNSKDNATLLGQLPEMEALMNRALELDPDWGKGSIHEFYISYDGGRSESIGGSVKRAKEHFDKAIQLAGGKKLGPYVSWAESVDVQQQNKKEFTEYLDKVLAFDLDTAPEYRLVNTIAQNRARLLKSRVDDLFAE